MPAPRSDDSRGATTTTASHSSLTLSLFGLLLALRIINALTLRTFFQPDEFFQSLEPAWQLAFGAETKAWITWEWKSQLRSSLHPTLFALVYLLAAKLSSFCGLSLPSQAQVLIAAPKVTQAVFAALLDLYTFKLAEKVHGRGSRTALTALALSIASPWNWFCSTRTLSNCLETTLSSIALYHWPWHWPPAAHILSPLYQLRLSLLLAAFACILRPTNALVWLAVSVPTLWQSSTRLRYVLAREAFICGSAVLALSLCCDRLYYGAWTFPPLRFLYFNIVQSLAVFYGRNRPDYYLTEGLPLLLTTALPFALVGLRQALQGPLQPTTTTSAGEESSSSSKATAGNAVPRSPNAQLEVEDPLGRRILRRLAWTSILVTLAMSLIAHKEVRFLYPILPLLHVLAAKPAAHFFLSPPDAKSDSTQDVSAFPPSKLTLFPSLPRRILLLTLLTLNTSLSLFLTTTHNHAPLSVLDFLRHQHESRLLSSPSSANLTTPFSPSPVRSTVAFLMPCHSTPWRSHLVHPTLDAWALTCEPPLHLSPSERETYVDEADQFYADPKAWMQRNMEHPVMVSASGSRSGRHWSNLEPAKRDIGGKRRKWPLILVFFGQLEGEVREVLGGSRYRECWRSGAGVWEGGWSEDWRRRGGVVVWCLE
ncbi:uncharacterized protein EI97DRAFT_430697 [Westerdykella ornata]|uniref:Mannosyltransferase n=1 Tax=Westerdykella ornata TaxID=318751 RepID=A0A6A6JTH8_WESOR|nr:uncharacterized protein EI97DRAFT_430697 [Westerdykella ornata]KAF2279667.1 hypothetical protein EI97DRAFT_430697 [Westerdykella ornata]